jgi:acetyl esterase/lipase
VLAVSIGCRRAFSGESVKVHWRVTAILLSLLSTYGSAFAQTPFYKDFDSKLNGLPGTLIRQEPRTGAPLDAQAYRVLYRSTGLKGEPIAVSGVIIIPAGQPPPGGRPIVAWAHPTTGIVPRCAPSLALFLFQQIQGLREMMRRGYIVAATDYPGLGTPGPHPYLVGESEGRAVLDSVRAARALAGAGASNQAAFWGHSQGGQAVLYGGILAKSYAPDLNVVGVAAAAPATELGELMRADIATAGGKNLLAMTLWSWDRVFGAPMQKIVDEDAIPTIDALANVCLESVIDMQPRKAAGKLLMKRFLKVDDPTVIEPWQTLLAQNTAGLTPRGLPVFIAQGMADDTVVPSVTIAYAKRLCDNGSPVSLARLPGVGHGMVAVKSSLDAIAWISDRFAGRPAPSDCEKP